MKKIYTLIVAAFFLFAVNGIAQNRMAKGNPINLQSTEKNPASIQPNPLAIASYTATVWSDNAGSPGTVLGSAPAITITNVDTGFYANKRIGPTTAVKGFYNNVPTFSSPVAIPANKKFWVGITFSYSAGDSAGLFTSFDYKQGDAAGLTGDCKEAQHYTYEQYSDASWHSVDDGTANSWQLDIAFAMYPVLSVSATPTSDTLTNHWHQILPVAAGNDTVEGYRACSASSFIAGNNCYGDMSKVQKFDSAYGVTTSNGTITSLLLWFAGKVTNTTGIKENNSPILSVSNYPNPANTNTTVYYELNQTSNVSISVYDITGKLLQSVNEGQQSSGNHTTKLDLSNLSRGMYFYTLSVGTNKITKKIVIE